MRVRSITVFLLLITIHLITNHCILWGAASHVVISEFATHSGNNASDEFVEIYNPTPKVVDMKNWALRYTLSGDDPLTPGNIIWEIPIDSSTAKTTLLTAFKHYLIGITTGYSSSEVPDIWISITSYPAYSLILEVNLDDGTTKPKPAPYWDLFKQNSGTLKLINSSRETVDKVGWGSTLDYEGAPSPIQSGTHESIRRLPESEDTDNNSFDFKSSDARTPANYSAEIINPSVFRIELIVSPRVFTPDLGQKCVLNCNSPVNSRIKVRVFDVLGRQVRTILYDYPGDINYFTYWDGKDDMQARVNIGYYIIHLQSYDNNGRQIGSDMKTVVVGTLLK